MMFIPDDTIAALSTPPGEGGVGVIRLSGNKALSIAEKIFHPLRAGSRIRHYRLRLGWIKDPETKEIIDEALLAFMQAPYSFTTQDVVELQVHGGMVALKKILTLCLKSGARLAEPGEFTRRAFEGGRIDLLQAESTLEIIRAKTEAALTGAASQLNGDLSLKIKDLRRRLIGWLTQVEAELEFPEEDVSYLDRPDLSLQFKTALADLKELLSGAEKGKLIRDGVSLVIAGRPNVGKSSLLNQLLGEDRAIVTEIPGTTRDTVEEWFNLYGGLVRLIDTAGIRHPKDEIEQLGIERTRHNLAKADLVYLVLDAGKPLAPEDLALIKETESRYRFCLLNKADLETRTKAEDLTGFLPVSQIFLVSAKTGLGINTLLKATHDFISNRLIKPGESLLVLNLRQRESLRKAELALKRAKAHLDKGLSEEFIALDLRQGVENLGELSGENLSEEILDRIFSEFCIGK